MSIHRRFASLKGLHHFHQTRNGAWMYRDSNKVWRQFHDDEHFANTVEAGFTVVFFTEVPDMPFPASIL